MSAVASPSSNGGRAEHPADNFKPNGASPVLNDVRIDLAGSPHAKVNGAGDGKNGAETHELLGKDKDKKGKDKAPTIGYFSLFRYADGIDYFLMSLGTICAMANGLTLPAFSIIFGRVLDAINGVGTNNIMHTVEIYAIVFIVIGVLAFFLSWVSMGFWMWTAERQVARVRVKFLRAVLRQEQAWFDVHKPGELSSLLAADTIALAAAMGEKVQTFILAMTTFFGGLVIGLVEGWQLALLILGVTPVLALTSAFMTKIMLSSDDKNQEAYAKAGAVADETFSSIRTVAAFGAEDTERKRYAGFLNTAEKAGIKKGFGAGVTFGFMWFVMFSFYGLALWFGSFLIQRQVYNSYKQHPYTGGDVMTVFFALLMGAFQVGQAGPCKAAFVAGQSAGARLFDVIERKSQIDPQSTEGAKLDKLRGDLQLQNLYFEYPTRANVPVLQKINLDIKAGHRVALVGVSGSGKSSIIALIERWYDPSAGQVLIDGRNVKELNLAWWRNQSALVGQEPVLFDGTIEENIRFGKPDATAAEIEQAARAAFAHDFIMNLQDGYQHKVGDSGSLLSGGQKQRVAIARAIIRNPKILLLDEATSALDNESERAVQQALDGLMHGRTTVIVAHRLSTIINCDQIYVLHEGCISEHGTHDQLMSMKGHYFDLVHSQQEAGGEEQKEGGYTIAQLKAMAVQKKGEASPSLKPQATPGSVSVQNSPVLKPASSPTASPPTFPSSLDSASSPGSPVPASASTASASPDRKRAINRADTLIAKQNATHGNIHEANFDKRKKNKKATKEEKAQEKKAADGRKVAEVPMSRLLGMAKPDWPYFLMAVVGALCNGLVQPLWAFVFGEITAVLYVTDKHELDVGARKWALIFVGMGAGLALCEIAMQGGMAIVGERLTRRLRDKGFSSITRQEMGWFDQEQNNPKVLSQRLASEATLVQNAGAKRVTVTVQMLCTLISGLILAFYYGWKLALVVLATLPLIAIAGVLQMSLMTGFSSDGQKAFEIGAKVSGEAIAQIRTVSSFGAENKMVADFEESLAKPKRIGVKKAHVSGIAFGFSNLILFGSYALTFWYGAKLVTDGQIDFTKMLKVIFAIVMAAMGMGQAAALGGDVAAAANAKNQVFALIDRKSKLDPQSPEGETPLVTQGQVEFTNVDFAYPIHPDLPVLRGLSLTIRPGETVALAGPSGSGKSTVVAMLLRYYDVLGGMIKLDGHDISKMNLSYLRQQVAVVSQEPRLFDESIEKNIQFGNPKATHEEVVAVCKSANIHDWIMTLPQGYDTPVGVKGSALSGGQKQRVAIARALIRKPRVLLLDEATSALDAESEKMVQHALDELIAKRERTMLVIAHRLSTVRNCDRIAVLEQGKLAEIGSHDELMQRNGLYAALVHAGGKDASFASFAPPQPSRNPSQLPAPSTSPALPILSSSSPSEPTSAVSSPVVEANASLLARGPLLRASDEDEAL